MNSFTYFISDLHLSPDEPGITDIFLRFLEHQAPQADALYILGDLFEAWIGDDNDTPFNQTIINALKKASDTGLPIYCMRGNRDFLIGQRFCEAAGMTHIIDPTVITLYDRPILLMHGDSLCTLDDKHQAFRRRAHSPRYQQYVLMMPLWLRRLVSTYIRKLSKRRNHKLDNAIMDVVDEDVVKAMQDAQVQLFIHGHTHKPAIHSLTINDNQSYRIVLAAWHNCGNALQFNALGEYQLVDIY